MLISDQCFPIFIPGTYLVKYYQVCDLLPKSTTSIVTKGCMAVQILQFFYIVQKYVFASFPTHVSRPNS